MMFWSTRRTQGFSLGLNNNFYIDRYKRGLETCRQANLCQSVHSNFHRVRATSMTQRRVENLLDTLAQFRLYRVKIQKVLLYEKFFSKENLAEDCLRNLDILNLKSKKVTRTCLSLWKTETGWILTCKWRTSVILAPENKIKIKNRLE